MKEKVDLTGQQFGKWTVINPHDKKYYWTCRCACGVTKQVSKSTLERGKSKSCGCFVTKSSGSALNAPKEFNIWKGMYHRCYNPKMEAYKDYGGRGIKLSDRWLDFENFIEDMGKCPEGMCIERINNERARIRQTTSAAMS